jgi:hypothetical protein
MKTIICAVPLSFKVAKKQVRNLRLRRGFSERKYQVPIERIPKHSRPQRQILLTSDRRLNNAGRFQHRQAPAKE